MADKITCALTPFAEFGVLVRSFMDFGNTFSQSTFFCPEVEVEFVIMYFTPTCHIKVVLLTLKPII